MSHPLLEKLCSDEFFLDFGVLSLPEPVRSSMLGRTEVKEIRSALEAGEISDAEIKEFAESLTREFKAGVQFPHELPLIALAVALEDRDTDFAEEYLRDLAGLLDRKVVEMAIAPRVAKLCYAELLKNRETRSATAH